MNTEQAIEEYMGEQFIEWLNTHITNEMQNWPIIKKMNEVRPKPDKIKKFALQVFLANEAFFGSREGDPGFLRFAIANLSESDDPLAESALELLEKRRVDEMVGHRIEKGAMITQNRERWVRLLIALGLTEEEVDRAEPKEPTRNFISELSDVYSTFEWQTAAGALAAHDRADLEEYKAFANLIKNNLSVDKELEIITDYIKRAEETGNSHILDKIVFDREAKELVWQGVSRQLEIRKEFLNGLDKYLEA